MLDPGSLGTLIIGLESARLEYAETIPSRRPRRFAGGRRQALAARLHAVADRLAGSPAMVDRRGEPAR